MKDYLTIRIWKQTVKSLRFIRAFTGESMVEILDRIVSLELKRVERGSEGVEVGNVK